MTTRTPQRRSECPPRYLVPTQRHEQATEPENRAVPLCRIVSVPHLKGYCRGGGPNVASTTSLPPTAWTCRHAKFNDQCCDMTPMLSNRPYQHSVECFCVKVRDHIFDHIDMPYLQIPLGFKGVSTQHKSPSLNSSSMPISSRSVQVRLYICRTI